MSDDILKAYFENNFKGMLSLERYDYKGHYSTDEFIVIEVVYKASGSSTSRYINLDKQKYRDLVLESYGI